MRSVALLAKAADGTIVPFTRAEEQWIDGSFTADIPRRRLSELFHVTQDIVSQVARRELPTWARLFLARLPTPLHASPRLPTSVSQVNPHVVPLLTMLGADKHHGTYSWLRVAKLSLLRVMLDRLRRLSSMQLLPAMYGPETMSSAAPLELNQKYSGDVTILPRIGGPSALSRMVQNPDPPTMRTYIAEGRAAAFKKLPRIKHLLAVETAVNAALSRCVYAAGPDRLGKLGSYDGGAHGISLSRMPSISSALAAATTSLAAAPSALITPPADPPAAAAGMGTAGDPTVGKAPSHRRTPTANGAWSAELLRKHLGDAMKNPAFAKTFWLDGESVETGGDTPLPSGGEAGSKSPHLSGRPPSKSPLLAPSSPGAAREWTRAAAALDSDGLLQLLKADEATPAVGEAIKMLLSRNLIVGTRALQQSAADKEALACELIERTEELHAVDAARRVAEARCMDLEQRLKTVVKAMDAVVGAAKDVSARC